MSTAGTKNQFRFLREIDLTEESLKPITNRYITAPKSEESEVSKNGVRASVLKTCLENGVLPLQKCEGANSVHCGKAFQRDQVSNYS